MAADESVNQPPDVHAFPAAKLGPFLRAMSDPEGTGRLDEEQRRSLQLIERAIAEAKRSAK